MYKLKEENQTETNPKQHYHFGISLKDQKDQLDNVFVKSKPEHRPQW